MALFSKLRRKTLLNPFGRVAIATLLWNHRHEVLRWGRSLFDQFVGRTDVSPARAARTGQLLFSIASDDRLRNAKQLRRVTMIDDAVDLDVDESWSELPRLLQRVRNVKGVTKITVNGTSVEPPALSKAVTA
jgi:hypothetical protein